MAGQSVPHTLVSSVHHGKLNVPPHGWAVCTPHTCVLSPSWQAKCPSSWLGSLYPTHLCPTSPSWQVKCPAFWYSLNFLLFLFSFLQNECGTAQVKIGCTITKFSYGRDPFQLLLNFFFLFYYSPPPPPPIYLLLLLKFLYLLLFI